MKKIITLLVLLTLLISVSSVFAANGEASITPTQTVGVNKQFTLTVKADPTTAGALGVKFTLAYNKEYLQFVSANWGLHLLAEDADLKPSKYSKHKPDTGELVYQMGFLKDSSLTANEQTFFTVTFKALKETPDGTPTTVNFLTDKDNYIKILTENFLTTFTGATITIIEQVCEPQCAGKECGPNGCGGSCGSCVENQECDAQGKCVDTIQPKCTLPLVYAVAYLITKDSQLCSDDDQGLIKNTISTLVQSCTEETKCEYVCNEGFTYTEQGCQTTPAGCSTDTDCANFESCSQGKCDYNWDKCSDWFNTRYPGEVPDEYCDCLDYSGTGESYLNYLVECKKYLPEISRLDTFLNDVRDILSADTNQLSKISAIASALKAYFTS